MYFSPLFNFGTLKRGPFTSLHTGFLSSDFFKINFFEKFFWELSSQCQTVCSVWILIRTDIMLVLICVQTDTVSEDTSKKRVKADACSIETLSIIDLKP